MRSVEELPGLDQGARAGALQKVQAEGLDLGIRVQASWVLADTLHTMVGTRVLMEGFQGAPSRAWLRDPQDRYYPLLETLLWGDECVLLFGPLAEGTSAVHLEVTRLDPPQSGEPPDAQAEALIDPWKPLSRELALRVAAWQAADRAEEMVPVGSAEGSWRLDLPVDLGPARAVSAAVSLDQTLPLGALTLHLQTLLRGASGWRLAYRLLVPGTEEMAAALPAVEEMLLAQAQDRQDLAGLVEKAGLPLPGAAPTLFFTLGSGVRERPALRTSGPWGPLGQRFYAFFEPVDWRPQVVRLHRLLSLPLPEPWFVDFDPRTGYQQPTLMEYPHDPLRFAGHLGAEIVYYHDDLVLLAPRLGLQPGPVREAYPVACRVVDYQGNVYDHSGRTSQRLPDGGTAQGLAFPPLHRLTIWARLYVESLDVSLSPPLEVEVPHGAL
jgi:hypothetical protein